jgi:membrane protease YdiL (CAAX protease family)
MFGMMILVGQAILITMVRKGWIERIGAGEGGGELTPIGMLAFISANSLGGLIAMGVTLAWLRVFDVNAHRRIGLSISREDIWLGLKGTVMILPPVMLIAAAVNLIVPYEHPVLESLEKVATPAVLLATFLGTAIVTPIVEEFLARGLLQGSLQAMADRGGDESPWYARAYDPDASPAPQDWRPQAWWPVIVSSLLFALLHGGQGAAPIPLFVLSLGLGYLYRQTGSLASPIIVHMCLNGLTLTVQFLNLSTS